MKYDVKFRFFHPENFHLKECLYVVTWICQSFMYFMPFAKKKIDQDFKACWSFCFELKVLNESKFSMPWPLCLWQCIKTNRETKIFETGIEILYETKSFKSITCISFENDISIARTFFETNTKTFFETKVFEIDSETFI